MISTSLQLLELQCEVNERLPENEKFEPMGWHLGTYLKFWKLHRQVLPESPRPKLILRLGIAGFSLFFSSIITFLLR